MHDGVLHNLQVLGESSQRLSAELKGQFSEIDWKKLSGLRNVIAHQYMNLDDDLIVEILRSRISPLKQAMSDALRQFP